MRMRNWRSLPGLAVLLAGVIAPLAVTTAAQAGAPYSCTTSSATGGCPSSGAGYTSYAGMSNFSSHWNFGSPYVDADMWGPVTGETQTLSANSPGDWQAVVNIPSGSNPSGAVTTYPDAGMQFGEPSLTTFGDITSSLADTVPQGAADVGWQGYDNWFNSWGDEIMIQTNYIHQSPCTFVAVQQFGGTNGVPVQTWGLCNFGGAGGEKVWQLAQSSAVVGGENNYSVMETSGSVDISAMTAWLITHGYMLTSTVAATTLTALSAGFEVTETASGGSAWTYSNLTFENHTGSQSQAPAVTTSAASGLSSSGATLNGTVNPNGQATTWQYQYGTTTSYGLLAPATAGSAGSGTTAVSEPQAITGLTANTAYHYRLTGTNATGTTNGADQQFTTSAAGGSTVAYGTTGPSSSGAKTANTLTMSWTQSISGSNPAVLAETAVGTSSNGDLNCGLGITDNGVAMTKLAVVHDDNQDSGYFDVFGLDAPPAGTNTFAATVTSGCSGGIPLELTGGSMSFTGAVQTACTSTACPAFSAPVTAFGAFTQPTAAIASSTGDMIAGFAANGSSITSAKSPATSRYIANQSSDSGAGNSAGATSASTGSSVTVGWNTTSDWWGEALFQVQHA